MRLIGPQAMSLGLVALLATACQVTPSHNATDPKTVQSTETQIAPIPTPASQVALPTVAVMAFTTTRPQSTGNLQHPELSEVSGLSASTRSPNTLWAINDSGNSAKLYALDHQGRSLASFNVGVNNRDWEDMASAQINGESVLVVGDIGDNLRNKEEHVIHIFIEPLLDNKIAGTLMPIHSLRFRYPDQSHDSESLAVADGWIYILTKEPLRAGKRQPSLVYRVPLDFTDTNRLHLAQKVAELAIPSNSIEASIIASLSGVDVSQPTAFDIDAQNRHAYLLTYRTVFRYTRETNQRWADVLAQPRTRVHTHSLSQAEALAISENGTVWFTSEKRPAPLWALPRAK